MAVRWPARHGSCEAPRPSPDKRWRFSKLGLSNQIVLVNGNIGLLARRPDGRLFSVIGFTIANGKIAEMNILADPDRLSRLDLSAIERSANVTSGREPMKIKLTSVHVDDQEKPCASILRCWAYVKKAVIAKGRFAGSWHQRRRDAAAAGAERQLGGQSLQQAMLLFKGPDHVLTDVCRPMSSV